MANSVDPDQTDENDSTDIDQTADNGKSCRLIRMLRVANIVDPDQNAENGK